MAGPGRQPGHRPAPGQERVAGALRPVERSDSSASSRARTTPGRDCAPCRSPRTWCRAPGPARTGSSSRWFPRGPGCATVTVAPDVAMQLLVSLVSATAFCVVGAGDQEVGIERGGRGDRHRDRRGMARPGIETVDRVAPGQQRVVRALHRIEREVVAGRRGPGPRRPGIVHRVRHRERGAGRPDGRGRVASSSRSATRSAFDMAGTTLTVVLRLTSPPFSDHARTAKVFGPRRSRLEVPGRGSAQRGDDVAERHGAQAIGVEHRHAVQARRLEVERRHAARDRCDLHVNPRCHVGRGRDVHRHAEGGADSGIRRWSSGRPSWRDSDRRG